MRNACAALLVTLLATGCGGGADSEAETVPEGADMPAAATAEEPLGSISITFPEEGSVVMGPTVTVELSSTIRLVPAGDMTPGTGHHHLYLDADLTEAGVPVPTVPGSIIHMGDASSEYTFEFDDMSYGPHRIIAVLADGAHVPLQPWVVDTVNFEVREPQQ